MTELFATTWTELAHRSGDGLEVTLLWSQANERDREDEVVVCVRDGREGAYFEIPAESHLALDVFYHPYAYRDFSTIEFRDARLTA